jgi:hypothetical protein
MEPHRRPFYELLTIHFARFVDTRIYPALGTDAPRTSKQKPAIAVGRTEVPVKHSHGDVDSGGAGRGRPCLAAGFPLGGSSRAHPPPFFDRDFN